MGTKIGAKKAEHWHDGGLLKARPGMLTGSLHKDRAEHPVPVERGVDVRGGDPEVLADISTENVDGADAVQELKKRELNLSGGAFGSAMASSSGGVTVKEEREATPSTAGLAQRVLEVQRDSSEYLKEFQAKHLLCK
eukprot:5832166-Pyramimonas_sp.AAC.1